MTPQYESLPTHPRGLVIGLLTLTILGWPWPFWNCYNGFISSVLFTTSRSTYAARFNTVAALGLVFGLVTIFHGLFGFAKVTIFAMDLDNKLRPQVRLSFINAYLVIETVFFFLTLVFGLAYGLYFDRSGYYDYSISIFIWINMGLTFLFQLISLPLALKLRSWARNSMASAHQVMS